MNKTAKTGDVGPECGPGEMEVRLPMAGYQLYAGVARHLEHTKEIDEERAGKKSWADEPGSWKVLLEGRVKNPPVILVADDLEGHPT